MLTEEDKRFYEPVEKIQEKLIQSIPKDARVLDVGPGWHPFPRADVAVDFQGPDAFPNVVWPKEWVKRDLACERLPFKDKAFDFIYCRQVLEDMWNPFFLMEEMQRVGKAGYIECPSPFAELCAGIEAKWHGYHHHHWVVYSDGATLKFIRKYPLVENLEINGAAIADILRGGHKYWNTYYPWKDRIAFKHLQNAVDFHMPPGYGEVLTSALVNSLKSTDTFWNGLNV